MTAFEIYSAIGGVNEDILEESEIMPNKKITKIIPLMAAAACFAVLAVGISHALRNDDIQQPVTESSSITEERDRPEIVPENESEGTTAVTSEATETSPAVTNYDTMPAPFGNEAEGTGGDENDGYYLPGNYILNNIPGALLDLRDSSEVDKWLNDKWSDTNVVSSIKDYMNIYSFITDFNITREEAETALEYYLNDNLITYADLDVIFSGAVELITKTFASEFSIAVGDRIYTPEWLYTHSIEEYKAAGITAEDILSRVDSYRYILFTDEARQAFSEKLSAFTGERVVIKEVVFQEKDDVYDIQEDIAVEEDTYDDIVDEEYVPEVYD